MNPEEIGPSDENPNDDTALDIDHPNVDSDPKDETDESEKEIEVTQNLDFNFVPYNEDICITGSKGSGKSYLANTLLAKFTWR